MAFKLDQSPWYRWPVKVTLVGEDGQDVEESFRVHFKRVSTSELEKVIDEFRSAEDNLKLKDKEFCERYVVGWDDINMSDGTSVPFSESARDALLDIHKVPTAIVLAWFDSIKLGQEKNLEKQPEPGLTQPVVQH